MVAAIFILAARFPAHSQLASKAVDTVIHETSFRLTLPGSWTAGDTNDPSRRTYQSANKNEGLTVSIFGSLFGAPGAMNHDEKSARFRTWVEKRRQMERKVADMNVRVGEPMYGESKGTLAARFEGFDPTRRRRFHCLILASSSAFEIFYYEALDSSESHETEHAKAIFNSVDIPE